MPHFWGYTGWFETEDARKLTLFDNQRKEKQMSHIATQTAMVNIAGIPAEIVSEGMKIVGAMLNLEGVATRYGNNLLATTEGRITVRVTYDGGTLKYEASQNTYDDHLLQEPLHRFQQRVEKLLPGACYLAARAMLARAQGKRAEIQVDNKTHQLRLAVEV